MERSDRARVVLAIDTTKPSRHIQSIDRRQWKTFVQSLTAFLASSVGTRSMDSPEVTFAVETAVDSGAGKTELLQLLQQGEPDLLLRIVQVARLAEIRRVRPGLARLSGTTLSDGNDDRVRDLLDQLDLEEKELSATVQGVGFEVGKGNAFVPIPNVTDSIGQAKKLERLPVITEHAIRIYEYLGRVIPVQRRRTESSQVTYNERALSLTADLMNAVYGNFFQRPLTAAALKARLQTSLRMTRR